jgi:hypothetical protein
MSSNLLDHNSASYLSSISWLKLRDMRMSFIDGGASWDIILENKNRSFRALKNIYMR